MKSQKKRLKKLFSKDINPTFGADPSEFYLDSEKPTWPQERIDYFLNLTKKENDE